MNQRISGRGGAKRVVVRIVQSALSEKETSELQALLLESGGKSLFFARGVFAAVATTPTEIAPPEWLSLLLGADVPDAGTLKRLLGLLMREYNACADCLALSVPSVPPAEAVDAIRQFAKGYVQIAQKDAAWTTDPKAFELTVPFMVLSGYAQPSSLLTIDPTINEDPETYLSRHSDSLSDDLAALYDFFKEKREKAAPATVAAPEKVGRNAACPCGSGKKYKKCCGATE